MQLCFIKPHQHVVDHGARHRGQRRLTDAHIGVDGKILKSDLYRAELQPDPGP